MATGKVEPNRFSTDEYRIRSIRIVDGEGLATTVFRLGEPARTQPTALQFDRPFRVQVGYECLMSELPDVSCGAAMAFTRAGDMEPIMYFNTNYPHSDEEMQRYNEQDFRRYIGRTGQIEAFISNLQVKPGDYLLTVGILPNRPSQHEFYELHYLQYPIRVLSNGPEIPAVFYPMVAFRHEAAEIRTASADTSPTKGTAAAQDTGAATITSAMIQAGVAVLRDRTSSGLHEPEHAVKAIYLAMRRAAGERRIDRESV